MIYILLAMIVPAILVGAIAYWHGKNMYQKGFGMGVLMGFNWVETFTDCKDVHVIYSDHCDIYPDDAIWVAELKDNGKRLRLTNKKVNLYSK